MSAPTAATAAKELVAGGAQTKRWLDELWAARLQALWAQLPSAPPPALWQQWAEVSERGEVVAAALQYEFVIPDGALTFEPTSYVRFKKDSKSQAQQRAARARATPSYFDKRVVIAPVAAPVKCYGMFAHAEIPPKTFIGTYTGEAVMYDPWCAEIKAKKTAVGQTDDAPYIPDELYAMSVELDDDAYVVDAFRCGNAARFINSSCDPNCVVRTRILGEMKDVEVSVWTSKPVKQWEQLSIDYSWYNPVNPECQQDVLRSAVRVFTRDQELLARVVASARATEPVTVPPDAPPQVVAVVLLLQSDDGPEAADMPLPKNVVIGARRPLLEFVNSSEEIGLARVFSDIPAALQPIYEYAGAAFVGITCFCGSDPTLNRRPQKCGSIIGRTR